VAGVDYALRQRAAGLHRRQGAGLRPDWVVYALVVVLAANWAADFRYAGIRSNASWDWGPIAAQWEHACERSRSGVIMERAGPVSYRLPCYHIARYRGPRR
jgi:hypothetical protein